MADDKPDDKSSKSPREWGDETTQSWCPACQGRAKACKTCNGTGMVTPLQKAQFERDRLARLTGQIEVFEELLEKLFLLLDARRAEHALIHAMSAATVAGQLAVEATALLKEFAAVKRLPQGDARRTEVVMRMLDLQRRALTYLASGR